MKRRLVIFVSYIKSTPREQMSFGFSSLDDMVDGDNAVRAIDAIVETLDKTKLDFVHATLAATGRPPHNPISLFKLYIYCYFEKIRSSRMIEKECTRNIEVMWLMEGIVPDHKCISEFRRQNKDAIKTAFSEFIEICDALGLIGKKMAAIDGSKFRANNARKKNITIRKIDKKLEHFRKMLDEYNRELEENDDKIITATEKINELNNIKETMQNQGRSEVSLTDPDSRLMIQANAGYEVSYNAQNAVDSKHDLVVATDVVNTPADQKQLYQMADKAANIMGVTKQNPLTLLADKGYFEGENIQKCEEDKRFNAIVARPDEKGNDGYQKSRFRYDEANDQYVCPAGEILYRKGKTKQEYSNRRACMKCQYREMCTKRENGRIVSRTEYEEAFEAATQRFSENKELYKQRQMIVEHPFGTVKRTLGFTYFLTRGMENVQTENRLHMLTYNIKRVLNIFSIPDLLRLLKEMRAEKQGETLYFSLFFGYSSAICRKLAKQRRELAILAS